MNNRQLSENFWLREFKYHEPEDDLLNILQGLRSELKHEVWVISSARTILEHIEIYRKRHKKEWLAHIPWNSRHLPAFDTKLRAADIKVVKSKDFKGRPNSWWRGDMIVEAAKIIASNMNIKIGIGVGMHSVHIDVCRVKNALWKYKYEEAV